MRSIFRILARLVLLAPLQIHAQNSPDIERTVTIPRLQNIVIDGDAGDWAEEGFRVEVMADEFGAVMPKEDFDPRFRLGWDARGLLVLIQVQDETAAPCPTKAIDFYSVRRGSLYDLIQIISAPFPVDRQHYLCGLSPADPKNTSPLTALMDRSRIGSLDGLSVEAAQKYSSDGYQYEVLLPWSNLKVEPAIGQKFVLQIAASDYDDGNEKYRACWVSESQPVDHPESTRIVRLGEAPSTVETVVARVSNRPADLPWAHFVASSGLDGAQAVVRSKGEIIGEAQLREQGGRLATSILLPQPVDGQPYDALSLEVDGEHISSATVDYLPAVGQLSLDTRISTDTLGQDSIAIRLKDSTTELLSDKHVEISVISPSGEIVRQVHSYLYATVPLSVSPGIYRVRATAEKTAGWGFAGSGAIVTGDLKQITENLTKQANEVRHAKGMEAYAGWFDYLNGQIADPYPPLPNNQQYDRLLELAEWIERVRRDPLAYQKLRGQREWAYLSEVDETGQPFQISIPDDYDQQSQWPLDVWLHGGDGMHYDSPYSWTDTYKGACVRLKVLGRGREGAYRDLSEVDVLEAMDYVKSHWNIDRIKIHIGGHSMGAYGTFNIASRFPDRFASARFHAGNGRDAPVRNMLNVPLYGLHDFLDWTTPIEMARASVAKIDQFGGKVILEESNEYGHGVGNNKTAVARSESWMLRQDKLETVNRIHYTATDESARGAYWVNVWEWGSNSAAATIDAKVGSGNELYLSLDNVAVAEIQIDRSPLNPKLSMMVSINRTWVEELPSPLPEKLYAIRSDVGWSLQSSAPDLPKARLHFPGGVKALYHGEPILIVWGTMGNSEEDNALSKAAEMLRHSSSPSFPAATRLRDGVPADYSPYGKLPAKADVDVTEADIAKYNLILLGDDQQNELVHRLADQLPVQIDGGSVRCSDNQNWPFQGRALGLAYCNPIRPDRLVYWIAADRLEFYRPGAALLEWQKWAIFPPDLVLMSDNGSQLVAARRFDSRWHWGSGYGDSPTISKDFSSREGNARILADMLRRAVNADYAIVQHNEHVGDFIYSPEETRVMDVVEAIDWDDVCTMTIRGDDLLDTAGILKEDFETERFGGEIALLPGVVASDIDPARTYRIAIASSSVSYLLKRTKKHIDVFEQTDLSVRQAWLRNWPMMVQPEEELDH